MAEAARNIACSGGVGVAITNCLNFGNPYNPEVYWQFTNAIMGMKDACEKFNTPVTGGNVSFYNQSSDEGPVFPTPTIGMLGILDDVSRKISLEFTEPGDHILLLGRSRNDISSSQYLVSEHVIHNSPAPFLDLDEEFMVQGIIDKIRELIVSAHDVSDGGLFFTLLESAMPGNLGFDVTGEDGIRNDAFLFGESQSRIIVSCKAGKVDDIKTIAAASGVACSELGKVTNGEIQFDSKSFGQIETWKNRYDEALEKLMA